MSLTKIAGKVFVPRQKELLRHYTEPELLQHEAFQKLIKKAQFRFRQSVLTSTTVPGKPLQHTAESVSKYGFTRARCFASQEITTAEEATIAEETIIARKGEINNALT